MTLHISKMNHLDTTVMTLLEKMAEIYHATLIMGSATPSLESYYKAQIGEYVLLKKCLIE